MADRKTFEFADVNPGLSGLAFAGEAEGGVCVGVYGVKPTAVADYESFFGRNAAVEAVHPVDVVLVSLPFSLFAGGGNVDPAVADPVRQASVLARNPKKTSVVLFRVAWGHAGRLGVGVGEYLYAVRRMFTPDKWSIQHVVSDDGGDLFVCAVALRRWNGKPSLPETVGAAPVPAGKSNPQEMLLAYGYPEGFALHNAKVDPNLLEGAVCVGNARTALSAALASVR